jgi:hypothetical protein
MAVQMKHNKTKTMVNPYMEVRSSETVQCRIVYPSARPDLQIRFRHCNTNVTLHMLYMLATVLISYLAFND